MEPSTIAHRKYSANVVVPAIIAMVTYSHTAILPVIAAPNCEQVISLPPEFVTPQDGHEKQDCETAAAKRWISKHRHLFQGQAITLLGDDLYSRQPMGQHCLDAEINFIFT
jgi:hypothetical protein